MKNDIYKRSEQLAIAAEWWLKFLGVVIFAAGVAACVL
jgi:hypothetical protein